MPQYAAFLGTQPAISTAEIAATAPGYVQDTKEAKDVLLFESTAELDQKFFDRLGGSLILARAVSEQEFSLSDVAKLLSKELESVKKKKVIFSLRTVGLRPKEVQLLYRKCKDLIKKEGRPCRYVGTDRKAAPAVVLHDSDLLSGKQGCELVVIRTDSGHVWIGRTVAAQNVHAYTKRDMEKPVRDTTVGLLPPKLAQMLLNFGAWLVTETYPKSKSKKTLTVYDPFCGTGVIPLECLLRGWPVLASDLSPKAVTGCEKNLDWIRKEEKILKKKTPSTVWKQDARQPFELKDQPDVIVSETTLGPALSKRPTLKEIEKMRTELEHLESDFIRNVATHLPGVPIACTWPVWYSSKGAIHLDAVWETIQELDYHAVTPENIDMEATQHATLLYRRPDQYVGREIVLLIPPTKA